MLPTHCHVTIPPIRVTAKPTSKTMYRREKRKRFTFYSLDGPLLLEKPWLQVSVPSTGRPPWNTSTGAAKPSSERSGSCSTKTTSAMRPVANLPIRSETPSAFAACTVAVVRVSLGVSSAMAESAFSMRLSYLAQEPGEGAELVRPWSWSAPGDSPKQQQLRSYSMGAFLELTQKRSNLSDKKHLQPLKTH